MAHDDEMPDPNPHDPDPLPSDLLIHATDLETAYSSMWHTHNS